MTIDTETAKKHIKMFSTTVIIGEKKKKSKIPFHKL